MELLRRLRLAKREERQAFLAAIAQPFLDRQAIAIRLRNLLALFVEEHYIEQHPGLATPVRLGELDRLEADDGQVLALKHVIDDLRDLEHPPVATPRHTRAPAKEHNR